MYHFVSSVFNPIQVIEIPYFFTLWTIGQLFSVESWIWGTVTSLRVCAFYFLRIEYKINECSVTFKTLGQNLSESIFFKKPALLLPSISQISFFSIVIFTFPVFQLFLLVFLRMYANALSLSVIAFASIQLCWYWGNFALNLWIIFGPSDNSWYSFVECTCKVFAKTISTKLLQRVW